MKVLNFFGIFLLFNFLYGVDDQKTVIKNLKEMSFEEFFHVRQVLHRARIDLRYRDRENLNLLVMISEQNNEIQQIIFGDQEQGQIVYIGDGRGFIVDCIDPELIFAVENLCKESGAPLVQCENNPRTACLQNVPGYVLEFLRSGDGRLVKKFEK